MKLELRKIHINDIQFGERLEVNNGVLTINKEELIAKLKEDQRRANRNPEDRGKKD